MAQQSQSSAAVDPESVDEVVRDVIDAPEKRPEENVAKRFELAINSHEKLKTCIDLLFTKALKEPAKQATLAQLCKKIGSHKVEWVEKDTVKETTFKKELLLRCQSELDRVKKDEDEAFRMSEAIEAADSSEEKSKLEAEHQEFMSRARERALCLFGFCGEMFKVGMITDNTMHECLVPLLHTTSDDEYLECFCRLITVTGQSLDCPKAKVRINGYFERITDILKKKRVSSKVRLMLEDVQELRQNQWIRKRKTPCWARSRVALADASKEQRESAILLGKFQAILNKLTPQRFQRLAEQALALDINTEKRLKGCVDLITERVLCLEERVYLRCYANLCKVLCMLKVEWEEGGKVKQTNFRRELLTNLQTEFENDLKNDEEFKKLAKAAEEAATPEDRKLLKDNLEETVARARERSVSNISFIGELFKLSMLSETIIHKCILRLLKSTSDEEHLEFFAKLITVTGKDLDHLSARGRMNGYFTRIADIIKKGKISMRVKFMLQDVQDLRKNSWVPRIHQVVTVKTIDEIRAEAIIAEREEELQRLTEQRTNEHMDSVGPLSRHGEESGSHQSEQHQPSRERPKVDRARLAALRKPKKIHLTSSLEFGASPGIIQEMAKSIFKACVPGSGVYHEDMFKKRCVAELKQYVNENTSLQVHVLNTLQVEVTKLGHPPMLLNQMFSQLYNADVIDKNSFNQWRDNGNEFYGKGSCIRSTKTFFERLDSART